MPVDEEPAVDSIEDESDTEPMAARHDHVRTPLGSLHGFLADVPPPPPSVEPIGFAHNGFHTDQEERFQPLSRFEPREEESPPVEPQKPDVLSPGYPLDIGSHALYESPDDVGVEPPSRHGLVEDEPTPNGRHSRAESDDASRYGRHGRHSRD